MKKNEVKIGGTYTAKVNGKVAKVRIDAENPHGGWNATNLETNRKVRIKTAQRLRACLHADTHRQAAVSEQTSHAPQSQLTLEETKRLEAKRRQTKKRESAKANGKLSALDAAAKVLAGAKEPMNAKELIEAMAAKKLWTSPGGKTPWATLYSAITREIAKKGQDARFKKAERGKFAANG